MTLHQSRIEVQITENQTQVQLSRPRSASFTPQNPPALPVATAKVKKCSAVHRTGVNRITDLERLVHVWNVLIFSICNQQPT